MKVIKRLVLLITLVILAPVQVLYLFIVFPLSLIELVFLGITALLRFLLGMRGKLWEPVVTEHLYNDSIFRDYSDAMWVLRLREYIIDEWEL